MTALGVPRRLAALAESGRLGTPHERRPSTESPGSSPRSCTSRLGGVQLCALLDAGVADEVARACRLIGARGADYDVGCRAVTVDLPREAPSLPAVRRLADARLAGHGHVATAGA